MFEETTDEERLLLDDLDELQQLRSDPRYLINRGGSYPKNTPVSTISFNVSRSKSKGFINNLSKIGVFTNEKTLSMGQIKHSQEHSNKFPKHP